MENFVTDLYRLADSCEYGSLRDEMDRLVVGLSNDKLSEKLQMNSGLTLEQAVQQARQSENVKKTTRGNPITPGSSKREKPHSFGIGET